MVDNIPPELIDFSISNTLLNLSDGKDTIVFGVEASDASGIHDATVYFDQDITYSFSSNASAPNGTWPLRIFNSNWENDQNSSSMTVFDTNNNGVYTISSLRIEDNAGNIAYYNTQQLQELGFETEFILQEIIEISGENALGEILNLEYEIANLDTSMDQRYQWFRDDFAILNANDRHYTITEDDLGTNISATIYYSDIQGNDKNSTASKYYVPNAYSVEDCVYIELLPDNWTTENNHIKFDLLFNASNFTFEHAILNGTGTSIINTSVYIYDDVGTLRFEGDLANGVSGGSVIILFKTGDTNGPTFEANINSFFSNNRLQNDQNIRLELPNINDEPIGYKLHLSENIEDDQSIYIANADVEEDNDGLPTPLVFNFQWQKSLDGYNWTNIDNANSEAFSIPAELKHYQIRVVASYIDNLETTEEISNNLMLPPDTLNFLSEDKIVTSENYNALYISGKGQANTSISIWLEGDFENAVTTTVDERGNWSFNTEDLGYQSLSDFPEDGDYFYHIMASDTQGNESLISKKAVTFDLVTTHSIQLDVEHPYYQDGNVAVDGYLVEVSESGNINSLLVDPINLGEGFNGLLKTDIEVGANVKITPQLSVTEDQLQQITVYDALDALKIAIGLVVSTDMPDYLESYQMIAADIDQSGDVTVYDALDILKAAIGLQTDSAPKWAFMSRLEAAEDPFYEVTKDDIRYSESMSILDIQSDVYNEFEVVLLGDVDLSCSPEII